MSIQKDEISEMLNRIQSTGNVLINGAKKKLQNPNGTDLYKSMKDNYSEEIKNISSMGRQLEIMMAKNNNYHIQESWRESLFNNIVKNVAKGATDAYKLFLIYLEKNCPNYYGSCFERSYNYNGKEYLVPIVDTVLGNKDIPIRIVREKIWDQIIIEKWEKQKDSYGFNDQIFLNNLVANCYNFAKHDQMWQENNDNNTIQNYNKEFEYKSEDKQDNNKKKHQSYKEDKDLEQKVLDYVNNNLDRIGISKKSLYKLLDHDKKKIFISHFQKIEEIDDTNLEVNLLVKYLLDLSKEQSENFTTPKRMLIWNLLEKDETDTQHQKASEIVKKHQQDNKDNQEDTTLQHNNDTVDKNEVSQLRLSKEVSKETMKQVDDIFAAKIQKLKEQVAVIKDIQANPNLIKTYTNLNRVCESLLKKDLNDISDKISNLISPPQQQDSFHTIESNNNILHSPIIDYTNDNNDNSFIQVVGDSLDS